MPYQTLNRRLFKEIGSIFHQPIETLWSLAKGKGDIKLRRPALCPKKIHREIWRVFVSDRDILQHQHDLYNRFIAQVALRMKLLYELFKGHILMHICAQDGITDALKQLAIAKRAM